MNYQKNFVRMMSLIEETFSGKHHEGQIKVTAGQRRKLERLHPACMSELANKNGPLVWVLIFPTSRVLMEKFLRSDINERELLSRTRPGAKHDCIYLCSATALPEARNKGKTFVLLKKAISSMKETMPVNELFVWPFSKEGRRLAKKLASDLKMKLKMKE